jgi:hypothetical protein
MAKTWKVTFIINQGSRGLSETYYISDPGDDPPFAKIELQAKDRATLLPKLCEFAAVKIGDVEEVGSSYVRTICQTYPNSGLLGEIVGDGALYRLEAGEYKRRAFILRALPDVWLIRDPVTDRLALSGAAEFAIGSYFQVLIARGFQLACEEREVDNPGKKLLVIAGVANQPKSTSLALDNAIAGVEAGDTVIVSGCRRSASKLNGPRIVTVPPVGSVVEVGFVYGEIEGYAEKDIANGKVRASSIVYQNITDQEFIDLRYRKTGRDFFVPRGRR